MLSTLARAAGGGVLWALADPVDHAVADDRGHLRDLHAVVADQGVAEAEVLEALGVGATVTSTRLV
jgi:hypothetical protein